MNNTIVLTGMMGSGKTSIGKELALNLGIKFFDSDHEIEKKLNMKIEDIFKTKGESYFRKIEEKICINLIDGKKKVVSLGGGAFLNSKVRQIVQKKSVSIWIDVNSKTIAKRINSSNKIRPMLNYEKLEDSVKSILKERAPIYQLATVKIEASEMNKKKVVQEIKKYL
ncbi:MAG: shikimate kinase [Pelagibacteraceae bacterium]|jgi:shikimate kinase